MLIARHSPSPALSPVRKLCGSAAPASLEEWRRCCATLFLYGTCTSAGRSLLDPSNLQPPWWMCTRPFRVSVPTPVNTVTQVSRSRSASKQAEDKPEKKGGFLSALGFNQETVYADDE